MKEGGKKVELSMKEGDKKVELSMKEGDKKVELSMKEGDNLPFRKGAKSWAGSFLNAYVQTKSKFAFCLW